MSDAYVGSGDDLDQNTIPAALYVAPGDVP